MAHQLTPTDVRTRLPVRRLDANKGTHGRVLIIGGSVNYIGAPAMAALAAYRVGAGLVTLAVPDEIKPIVANLCPEATFLARDLDALQAEKNISAVVFGPGLGQLPDARAFFSLYIRNPLPVPHVMDADALNMLAPLLGPHLPTSTVLTPHPGEMARLTQLSVADIQANRLLHASHAAEIWDCVLLLKGANTVIAAKASEPVLLPFSNPAMAVAGTGDVLAGCIGGFLAQGISAHDAAICGAFVHGQAGEIWREQFGDAGLLASDLLTLLPGVIRSLKSAPSAADPELLQ